jgi:peptide/nickel transport system permease protein
LTNLSPASVPDTPTPARFWLLGLLWRDKLAFVSAIFLIIVVVAAIAGPFLSKATAMNLRMRNAPPFQLDAGWEFILGGDTLGRSVVFRLIQAAGPTLTVAAVAVLLSLVIGSLLGLIAGARGGAVSTIILRAADLVMSFPPLLLALVVLYVLQPSITNVIILLAITRIPVFIRTVRAEVLEIRSRLFITAAQVLGASEGRILFRHLLPVVLPTIMTMATLEFGYMMLTEAGLSFLGVGVQLPDITWGLMVAEGKNYLSTAWWLAFWPGFAIMLTTVALTSLSNWLSIAIDPRQRWRLEQTSTRQEVLGGR